MKTIYKNPLFWILIASILPVLSLLHPGIPLTHDGQDHVARIANFYASLKEGIVVPRWAANLNWGYGHPILMFLYPLPEYLASAFHSIGFTLVDSTKLVFGLSFIAGAVAMYLWMSTAFGTRAGVIGSLLYTFAPYRFVDLHVRGALGEHVAFIFPPLILYFLRKQSFAGVSLSIAALILAHNAIALMFIPIIAFYGLYLLIFEAKHKVWFIVSSLGGVLLGFAAAGFFWIPAILEGKYTLRDIVTAGEALKRFVPWTWFIYSPWNYGGTDSLTKSLGIMQWTGIVGGIVLLFTSGDRKRNVLICALLFLLAASLFIMTSWSIPVWRAYKILQNFQFPWRFLSLSVFLAAVLGGIALPELLGKFKLRKVKNKHVLFIALCLLSVFPTVNMWYPKGYQERNDSFYSGVYSGTTDTGESSPIWSVRFMEHTPANPLDVGQGDTSVRLGKRQSTVHEYILDVRKPSLMVENTLFFPGWMIYVNELQAGIEWQNPDYRGLMTFRVTPGENQTVRVVFEDTKVRLIANRLSIVAFVCIAVLSIGRLIWKRKK